MLERCDYRDCRRLFDSDRVGQFFCCTEHRSAEHAALKRTPCSEEPTPPAAFSTSPTLAPRRRTVSVREGFAALGNQALSPHESARRNDERAADMIARLALGPRSANGKEIRTERHE
jgi:hypothetical protein